MKYLLITLLAISHPLHTLAQKNDLYADIGISMSRLVPGPSVTYNHNFFPFLGLGIGVQGYDYHATQTNFQFIPTIYGDLRFKIRPQKISQFFLFLDVGINMYMHSTGNWGEGDMRYSVQNDNGLYIGPGIGYYLNLMERGRGVYTTLKIISNGYKADALNIVTNERSTRSFSGSTLVYAVGFKF